MILLFFVFFCLCPIFLIKDVDSIGLFPLTSAHFADLSIEKRRLLMEECEFSTSSHLDELEADS